MFYSRIKLLSNCVIILGILLTIYGVWQYYGFQTFYSESLVLEEGKLKKRNMLFVFTFILLTACGSKTIVTDEAAFAGKGKYWNAKYIYNAKLYNEKHINWVEIAVNEVGKSDFDINDMDIEFKSRDGSIKGKVKEMERKININSISILVGTVNFETYKEDKYELIINSKEKKDVVKLKAN